MNRFSLAFAAALASSLCTAPLAAEELSAEELIRSIRESVPEASVHSNVQMTSSRGWTRELEIHGMNINDELASFIEVLGPQDVKDTRFLFIERANGPDEQHIYVPLLKRAIRIVDSNRNQAFLGSDFYVSDLVAPEVGLHKYSFVGEEEVLGRACRKVEAVPNSLEGEVYSKVVFVVDPKDKLILKSYSYDLKGQLLKVWTVDKLEKIDAYWTMMAQTMANVQDETTSTIAISRIEYNVDLPGDIFSRARLIR